MTDRFTVKDPATSPPKRKAPPPQVDENALSARGSPRSQQPAPSCKLTHPSPTASSTQRAEKGSAAASPKHRAKQGRAEPSTSPSAEQRPAWTEVVNDRTRPREI